MRAKAEIISETVQQEDCKDCNETPEITNGTGSVNNESPETSNAIYATVNLDMKRNSKKQRDSGNGNLEEVWKSMEETENIVAVV